MVRKTILHALTFLNLITESRRVLYINQEALYRIYASRKPIMGHPVRGEDSISSFLIERVNPIPRDQGLADGSHRTAQSCILRWEGL